MKSSQRIVAMLTMVIGATFNTHAQDATPLLDLKRFQEASGQYSAIYAGRQETRYAVTANGHQYWESTEFQFGDIVFEDRLYKDIYLNFDAVQQEILVMANDKSFIVAIDPDKVRWFTMGGSEFINIDKAGITLPDNAGGGICEVLHKGPQSTLLLKVGKELSFSPNNVNGKEIGYDDPNYRYDILTYFAYKGKLYLAKGGNEYTQIKNKAALKRQFPSRKKEFSKIAGYLDHPSLGTYSKAILNQIDQ